MSRRGWILFATFRGRRAMRISICSWATSQEDIERSTASFAAATRQAT
jgi:hypothetical protein